MNESLAILVQMLEEVIGILDEPKMYDHFYSSFSAEIVGDHPIHPIHNRFM